ncbi:MAG: aldehyde ferredoxin oxidoreductase family protein [Lentisphaerae bacterium]|jgi:aldehyde:ferredoxin oxidoreductase|nr:aldehyde ferredoxin oxidoreductase family protein [Lentisphaerota bacterium]MBT4819592.1 aldehyde ferredoxin oxidoreductase family protein [Lentisphaerota bacterium]MBT5610790.1 aldehyde ferredoxin oxidoreductase family protein [Lentisphaerota bacterium]MBT7053778.1 aldehyde ferredoxin oxidoreductase family protein [Lentisphaerota bacterium]MBT7841239.1 aldehyde ferredoxin oxidoreductase family protein [Lentisphaerota bacterium]
MTIKSGYFKRHLHIDLSADESQRLELSDDFLERFVGGRGFGVKLLWDHLEKHDFKVDPLGPENLLVISPGPLTGTYLPSSGKISFISISPATGIYGDSSMGGTFGIELRQTGVDVLSITGRADELSFIFIDGDDVSVIPCPQVKGKTCLQTEGMIKEYLGTHDVDMAVIGIAGENLVKFACVNADWSRNAGRTGIGAILGSKNIKAVVVRGSRDLPVDDIRGLVKESDRAYAYQRGHKFFKLWQDQGLMNVIEYANNAGFLPTHNFKDGVFKQAENIDGYTMLRDYKIGDSACFACAMCCGNICLVKQGKYTGTVTEGPEYESCAMLGSNVGIGSFDAVLQANSMCDELGIDTISTGNIVGAVIEGYERGILTLDDLDGQALTWGDDDAILELVRKMACREGIGDILADGAKRIIETWPKMVEVILHVKGLEQSAYDSRPAATMALAYATSDIGAHHTRAWTIAKEIELGKDWSDEEKVDLVIYHQSLRPLFDMLGVCRLPWIELGLNEKHYEKFYRYVTGNPATLDDMLKLSNDIYDATRLINTRLGMTRQDDSLPHKVANAPIQTGPQAGKSIDQGEFDKLLSLYYQRRGWSAEGVPQVPASFA